MGSDRFGGGAAGGGVGVTFKEVEAPELGRVSIVVGPSIDRSNPFLNRKDEKIPDAELSRHANQRSIFNAEGVSADFNYGSTNRNSSPSLVSAPEAKLQRKYRKVGRSSSGCSKKSRIEVSINEHGADDMKGISIELGSFPAKCNISEKIQVTRQKNHLNGKRGDRRNGKVPVKSKYDSFSLKAGLLSFSSSAGGNNILGVCGLKPDINDLAKNVDELSLNELLDGSYHCPSFVKDKGKKAASSNESLLNSVNKACSILRPRKPIRPQCFTEIDNTYNRKDDICTTDESSCSKDPCSQLEIPSSMLDFPLYQPVAILERLALPAPKDLDSLLLDAAKPVLASRNNPDLRSGKPMSHRAGLPPFPSSLTSAANCKSNSDAVKLSMSRSTCQARWVKIGNTSASVGASTDFLAEFESLTYDHRLVPSVSDKSGPSEKDSRFLEQTLSSSAELSLPSQVHAESVGSLKSEANAGHSPTILAAAQTLYDIATSPLIQNQHEAIKWPKKPSQKAMKARKLKSIEKSRDIFAAEKSCMGQDDPIKNADETLPSKKPRLTWNEKNGYLNHTNSRKGPPLTWSTSRSSRSSPSKSMDSVAETEQYNANIVKNSYIMPPPPRVLDRECNNSQQKLRKLMSIEWNRGRG